MSELLTQHEAPPTQWTPARVEQLLALFREGLSCAIIGQRLGTTRNAVIGRLHRMGYTKPQPTTRVAPKREGRSDGSATIIRFRPKVDSDFKERAAAVALLHLALADLESHHCRFPYGEGPYSFCGHKKAAGSSYCPEHFALTWRARQ